MSLVNASTEPSSRSRLRKTVGSAVAAKVRLGRTQGILRGASRRLLGICALICAALTWIPLASAQSEGTDAAEEAESARGLKIESIEVAGNRRVSTPDVKGYLKERPGQSFSPEVLARDVRELWGSGFFDAIEVDLDRTDAGAKLRFIVRERPTISKLTFVGNTELDVEDMTEDIEVKQDTVLSRPAIARSIQKIRDLYAEKGYFLAEAESEIVPGLKNDVEVKFIITEHSQVSVKRITFIGNDNVAEAELRAAMFTGAESPLNLGSGGPFRQDAFERDIAVINALYYDRGFLNIQVHTPRVMLTPDRSGIELSITINEGPRYKIRQLRVFEKGPEGREIDPIGGRVGLRKLLRADSGDYFNRAEVLEDLGAVRSIYRNEGYANVEANPQTRVHPKTNEVDVIVPIERGDLVYFDRIEVRGNTKTRDKVIRRELEIVEGQKFSEALLERSRRRVTALGFFERVDLSTAPGSSPDRIDVQVEVTERPTGTFQVGAGFSSIESFIGTAQVQQSNLLGNGQNFSLNAQISALRFLVNTSLFEPYFLDTPISFSISAYNQQRNEQDFSRRSIGGSVTFGYPLIQPELQASLTYTIEDNLIEQGDTNSLFQTQLAATQFRLLPLFNLFNDGLTSSVRPTLTWDTRDNRLFPTSGIYIRGSTEFSAAALGADTEFLRNQLTARFYYPLGGGAVLKLNTEFGMITSPRGQGVPIFNRFFLGGIFNLRGFNFRSIGPRVPLTSELDPNSTAFTGGTNIGGNLMFYENLEFDFPIVQDVGIRGVVFLDAGNAWNLEEKFCGLRSSVFAETDPCFSFPRNITNVRSSWGVGLRWFSPLGPLRFELGIPFKTLPGEESSVFEFAIGNFF